MITSKKNVYDYNYITLNVIDYDCDYTSSNHDYNHEYNDCISHKVNVIVHLYSPSYIYNTDTTTK